MFDIFKKDIKVGDKVKLYLTTGKEPEGLVVEIGDNFVLLQSDDQTRNRFFDKLIGGWDVIAKKKSDITIFNTNQHQAVGTITIKESNISTTKKNIQPTVNKDVILDTIAKLLKNLNNKFLTEVINPNANIISVMGTTCIASTESNPGIRIFYNTIIEEELISEIKSFSVGSIIPIYMVCYNSPKTEKTIPTLVVRPNSVRYFLLLLKDLMDNENYKDAKRLSFVLKSILPNNKKHSFYVIFNELKTVQLDKDLSTISIYHPEDKEEKNIFKKIEKEINQLIQNSEFELAIIKIDEELKDKKLDNKYKSSLLLKKAQAYSSLNNPAKSEDAYQDLISFNEKTNPSAKNNLSHLYTELARLQALNPEKQTLALESVNKALKYNPNNNFANNLFNQFQGKRTTSAVNQFVTEDNNLLVDTIDDSTVISKMIDIDIQEHKFTDSTILENGGKATSQIAQQLFEKAKETTKKSEKYPAYLEAAKAFKESNVGSYDVQDYFESAAHYSRLKGDSIFSDFKTNVVNGIYKNKDVSLSELTRLKDSAGSYYIESLNLLSNIAPELLLAILANYLIMDVAYYYFNKKLSIGYGTLFNSKFSDVFFECVRSKNAELEKIAFETVIRIGAASPQAWNKLAKEEGGTAKLFSEFDSENKTSHIYGIINEIEGDTSINIKITPKIFLSKTFEQRKRKEREFENVSISIKDIVLEPHTIIAIIEKWEQLTKYWKLLSATDIETKEKIDDVLSILKPYLNRNQTERTNLLIQSQRIIDTQIKFINNNTTFYGRTFFFPLLNKWKKETDNLLGEKIAQSYPSLEVIIDPPYFVNKDGEKIVNVIIKNDGETTAEGFELNIKAESTIYEDTERNFSLLTEDEIPAGEQISTSFIVAIELLNDSNAVEIEINAIAIYQKKRIKPKEFSFTIEEEPTKEYRLTYDDIVWNEGQIPEKHLFIGRKQIVNDLAQHYESVERHKPYILYGLTRTGKSSILKYLKENLQGDTFSMKGKEMTLLPFSWDLSQAASFKKASDFWEYTLYQQVYEELDSFAQLYSLDFSNLQFPEKPRAKDFPILLNYLKTKNIYPFFLIDEFSFIKTLIDGDIVNAAFLHTLRQYSLDGLASFIYAGTYDIKQLISDPKYGITGQLVNAIEEQINEISDEDAEALIEVMKDKLIFTPEAVSHIQTLSGNIPYFIQIICKYCGFYASENNRLYIGYPELEKVIKILTGKEEANSNSLVKSLPENVFQNNQFSPADPKEVNVLISSIMHFNRDKINNPRGVGFDELQRLWAEKEVEAFRPKLAESINLLKDKKILIQEEDEGMPVYKFAVDLFRRWWTVHHSDIDLEISTII
jgi:hypothetical protein